MSIECADCTHCPLGHNPEDPVEAETHGTDRVILIGESPAIHEVMEGRPFVGPGGLELQRALNSLDIQRPECHLTYAVMCRPPKNDLDATAVRVGRINRKRQKKAREDKKDLSKLSLLRRPQDACKDRLWAEIRETGITKIICMGKVPARVLRGGNVSIMAIRGGCEEITSPWGTTLQVAYTMSPAMVMMLPVYREVFRSDLSKGFRYFEGSLDWQLPKIIRTADPEIIRGFISRLRANKYPVAYDLETDGINPMTANIRCVGMGDVDTALIVEIRSIHGNLLCLPEDLEVIKDMMREFYLDPRVPLLGHNAGQYDRLCMESWLGITPKLTCDSILLHLLADNELPHNLGFIGSFYTDNPEAWKASHTAVEAKTDEELHIYCGADVAVTARIAKPLMRDVVKRKQQHLLAREHTLQHLGAVMQSNGIAVDLDRATEHIITMDAVAKEQLAICKSIGGKGFNPNSTRQMGELLFEKWKLSPHHYSEKTGDPSTDDETLRTMIVHYGLVEERMEFLRSVRSYRKVSKLMSTFIRPLIEGKVDRIHPSYNRLPVTGRYSSSNPNAQNIPKILRDMYVAPEGCVLIGADMDQLELRYIAEEANAKHSIHVINSGLDPHNETMEVIYGKGVWELDGAPKERKLKGKGIFKNTRDITKNTRYAWQYAASTKRIHEQIASVEDDKGNLLYAHLTIEDVRQVVEGLKRADPEIPRWWGQMESKYRREGFIADTLWGRRRYFKNEDKINEIVNFPVQSGAVAIVNEGMIELIYGSQDWFSTVPINEPGGVIPESWLISHGHDALYLEVPEDKADYAAGVLERVMSRRRKRGAKVDYTAESEIGSRWIEV
tara:strand:+ start:2011 stop:4530 length:2520 start_codon:yes stop_codon:yes gene_type:complete